jgi:hypothetical protein
MTLKNRAQVTGRASGVRCMECSAAVWYVRHRADRAAPHGMYGLVAEQTRRLRAEPTAAD